MGANAQLDLFPDPLGMDLYRDMELAPSGTQMFYLTGNGMFMQVGAQTIEPWSDLVEEDIYRDMELITDEQSVVNVVITDYDGNLTVLGDGSEGSAISRFTPPEELVPGTVRQVKLFPGDNETLMLIEGSGQVHFLTNKDLNIPTDLITFADAPGIDDDKVVDVETTRINLSSVVETVNEVLRGLSNEDADRVLRNASPNYRDRTGADINGLQLALNTLFTFYEIESFAQARAVDDSFVITNQGDTVIANVLTDFVFRQPSTEIIVPEVEEDTVVPETIVEAIGVVPFTQNIRIREVGDGRGWNIGIWKLVPGRDITEVIDQNDEIEITDFLTFQRNNNIERLFKFTPRSQFAEEPITFRFEREPGNAVQNLLIYEFVEGFLNFDGSPPAVETTFFPGNVVAIPEFDRIRFRFEQTADGNFALMGMNLRVALLQNSETFELDEEGELPDAVFTELEDLNVEDPFGFNFDSRGPVPTAFETAADLVFTGDEFQPTSGLGAVMMLEENTDIFSINVENFLRTHSFGQVRQNPFDPVVIAGDENEFPGFSASVEPGRAYFVIDRTGQKFGFIQLTEDLDLEDDEPPVIFDYRSEESFILPDDF